MLGLLVAMLYIPREARWGRGTLELRVSWIFPWWWPVGGQCLGGAVVCYSARGWQSERTRAHEHWHFYQGLKLGPFFPLLYGFQAVYQLARGNDFYRANPFEVQAYDHGNREEWPPL